MFLWVEEELFFLENTGASKRTGQFVGQTLASGVSTQAVGDLRLHRDIQSHQH